MLESTFIGSETFSYENFALEIGHYCNFYLVNFTFINIIGAYHGVVKNQVATKDAG